MFKKLLTEGVSPIVYHFCPLSAMFQIAESNCFKFSDLEEIGKKDDYRMNTLGGKTYRYYLCVSRSPSSEVGYTFMRAERGSGSPWNNALVRIELDGNALNSRFKGKAVNFYTEPDPGPPIGLNQNDPFRIARSWKMNKIVADKPKLKSFTMPPSDANRKMFSVPNLLTSRMSEYEDRVLSDKQIHDYIDRYIRRIDIYVTSQSLSKPEYQSMIRFIIDRFNNHIDVYNTTTKQKELKEAKRNIVFVYDNKVAFNSMNVKEAINNKLYSKNATTYFSVKFSNGNELKIPYDGNIEHLKAEIKQKMPNWSDATINTLISNQNNFVKNDGKNKYNIERFSPSYNGQSFMTKYPNGEVYEQIPSNIDGLVILITCIAFNEHYTDDNFYDAVTYLCKKSGLANWKSPNGEEDYTEEIYDRCIRLLSDDENGEARFWDMKIGQFYIKNQPKKEIMAVYNILKDEEKKECIRYAQKTNKAPVSLVTTYKRKFREYLNWRRNGKM
jgi:ABC-type sugar transport system ATPase subunit